MISQIDCLPVPLLLRAGKTLGFLLPGFHSILTKASTRGKAQAQGGDRRSRYYKSPEVLVLAPTRELGNQIAAEAAKYHVAGIDTVCVYGGASKGAQMASLRKGADCVVATPGRCIDLIDEGAFDLSQIRYLVLDEADRM
jgi:superfamily II DNA/RNA helicase